jgi:hypothetical protein
MAESDDELRRAQEDARRAREDADRLRSEARELERRLRNEARERARRGRHRGPEAFDLPGGVRVSYDGGGRPTGSEAKGSRVEQAFSLDGVREVSIDQTAGHLTVRICSDGETPGVYSVGQKTTPDLDVRHEGERLVVEVKMAKGWLFRRKEGPTTVVRVLPGLANLRVNLSYGDLQVRDVSCETIKLDVGAGTITGYSTSGNVTAEVGAGKLSLNAHRGLAKCNTGTGDVLLDVAAIVPGDYSVDVGMGRAEVRLPAGEQVYVKTSSGIGRARNEYPGAPESAPTRLRLITGIGEVIVKTREVGAEDPRPPVTPKPQRSSRSGPASRRRESEELRVLQMLEQGRITSQDAADLIAALQGAAPPISEGSGEEQDRPGEDQPGG